MINELCKLNSFEVGIVTIVIVFLAIVCLVSVIMFIKAIIREGFTKWGNKSEYLTINSLLEVIGLLIPCLGFIWLIGWLIKLVLC